MVKKAERITKQARVAAEKWRQYWQENINQYHIMHEFVLGEQWTDEESDMLKTYKKIPLQFNKLATLINTLLGEQQQNTPQLQVVPMENCDEQTAEIRELIVKDIMFSGGAKNAYQVAASQAFIGGFGAFCLGTDYVYDKSFDQDIIYRYFKDATRCYWDISAERLNKTDGMHCGYLTRMSREKFRDLYGKNIEEKILGDNQIAASKEEVAAAVEPQANGSPFSWADGDCVTIQDHFVKKHKSNMLYKLSNGRIIDQEELDQIIEHSQKKQEEQIIQQMVQEQQHLMQGMQPGMEQQQGMLQQSQMQPQQPPMMESPAEQMPQQPERMPQEQPIPEESIMGGEEGLMLYDDNEPVRIEDKRETKKSIIKHYKICGEYILDKTEFPSEQLPLVFVDQNSYYNKNGKQVCRPFIIDAKDAQKYINYLGTQSAYVLKVSRFDQWIGSKRNVASNDTQQMWRDPLSIQGMLTYDESPNGDKPQQVTPPELSQSLLTQYQRAIEDLYTSTGLYPSRLGMQGNEVSGAAIDARTRQGSYSTYCAFNAINRAIATGGEIVNEMIPRVYDAERVIALMTPDEGMKNITINQEADEYGERIELDIRKGSYQVRLLAGPSYEGQKEQALESLNMALQANPQLFNLIADLYAENLPLMNTIELKNRLKSLVPPQIIEAGKSGKSLQEQGPQKPSPEEMQIQMQQQQMQMEAQYKQQQIELKKQELALKQQQMQIDLEIEKQKLQAEEIAVMGEIEESKLRYAAETQRTESDASISHANNLVKILTHKIG